VNPARLVFNERRRKWVLWFEERPVMEHRNQMLVRQWAGRHNYSIQEGT
jgi:hypothetical protein